MAGSAARHAIGDAAHHLVLPRLAVFTGPMWSGKTSALIEFVNAARRVGPAALAPFVDVGGVSLGGGANGAKPEKAAAAEPARASGGGSSQFERSIFLKHAFDTRTESSVIMCRHGTAIDGVRAVTSLDAVDLGVDAKWPAEPHHDGIPRAGRNGDAGGLVHDDSSGALAPSPLSPPTLVVVDEAQFFAGDLLRFIERAFSPWVAPRGTTVGGLSSRVGAVHAALDSGPVSRELCLLVSGLDLDYARQPFGHMLDVVDWAMEAHHSRGLPILVNHMRAWCSKYVGADRARTAAHRTRTSATGSAADVVRGLNGKPVAVYHHPAAGRGAHDAAARARLHYVDADAHGACGEAAAFSQRLAEGGDDQVLIGSADFYQPACEAHHVAEPLPAAEWRAVPAAVGRMARGVGDRAHDIDADPVRRSQL